MAPRLVKARAIADGKKAAAIATSTANGCPDPSSGHASTDVHWTFRISGSRCPNARAAGVAGHEQMKGLVPIAWGPPNPRWVRTDRRRLTADRVDGLSSWKPPAEVFFRFLLRIKNRPCRWSGSQASDTGGVRSPSARLGSWIPRGPVRWGRDTPTRELRPPGQTDLKHGFNTYLSRSEGVQSASTMTCGGGMRTYTPDPHSTAPAVPHAHGPARAAKRPQDRWTACAPAVGLCLCTAPRMRGRGGLVPRESWGRCQVVPHARVPCSGCVGSLPHDPLTKRADIKMRGVERGAP